MGDKISLNVAARNVAGKKVAALRQQGFVPGIVYGHNMEPAMVQAESRELLKVIEKAGKHTPIHLAGDEKRLAMIKSVDFDPTKQGVVRHVAFHAVNAKEAVVAEVPVHLVGIGESAAERAGLVVLQSLDKVEVKALPMELPEAVEVSILGLAEAGDHVTLADAKLPKGVEFVEHDSGRADDELKTSVTDQVVATVYEPAALQAANEAAAGDATDESGVELADAVEKTESVES